MKKFNSVIISDVIDDTSREREYNDLITSIDLYKEESYDCTTLNVWSYRSSFDIRDGINIKFGNMCNGFPFEIVLGIMVFNSECAYIAGAYASNDNDSISIQKSIIAERNGMKCKRLYRNKPEFTSKMRKDFYKFNVQWMIFVVYQKAIMNQDFGNLLKAIPREAHTVENTTLHKGSTATFWGARNHELMTARKAKAEELDQLQYRFKKDKTKAITIATNQINNVGTFIGKNVMGKIIKLISLSLIYNRQPLIDYKLLDEYGLYILGQPVQFKY